MSESRVDAASWDAECLLEEARHQPANAPPAASLVVGRLPSGAPSSPGGKRWTVRVASTDYRATLDPAVDPALLKEAAERGAALLLDWNAGAPVVLGVLATQRTVNIDQAGRVDVEVTSFRIAAKKKVVLSVAGAFVQLADREAEVYGTRVLVRARELAKTLAAMVSFN